MNLHKSTLALLLTALGLLLTQGTAYAAAPPSGGTLYVQQAAGGTLVKGADGLWRLTLRRPDLRTTSFSDRPTREGGSLPLSKFVSSWGTNFGSDRPNAALEVSGAPASRDVALVELGRPRYHRAAETVTFVARPLRSASDPALASFERRADRGFHGAFGRASLFIDDGGPANLLTFSFENMGIGPVFEIGLPKAAYTFGPPPTLMLQQRYSEYTIQLSRSVIAITSTNEAAGIDGDLAVISNPTEPLEIDANIPAGVRASASWAGGPTVELSATTADYVLEPGSDG